MNIGVVGLGLIGGSMAKAIKQNTPHTVYASDIDPETMVKSRLTGAMDEELDNERLGRCDMLIVALYPRETIEYLTQNAAKLKPGALVLDCGGVKQPVCRALKSLAQTHDFVFVGAHPMAGREYSGFDYAKGTLFAGASMILTPYGDTPIGILDKVKQFCLSLGFGRVVLTTPEEHDRIIALTSQLAHILSNAYVKSPTAQRHNGFSAGSFRDLTRVARLNENMWSQLFMENREMLLPELEGLIGNLQSYRDALESGDEQELKSLLRDGREQKQALDG